MIDIEHYAPESEEIDSSELPGIILSDITHFMKYGRHIPQWGRRETFEETVIRNREMHINKFPELRDEIIAAYKLVLSKLVLPSMRSLQFGGRPIEVSPNRIYNCSYLPMDDYRAFSETIFLLLGGTGVGISVQQHHIEKLPEIKIRKDRKRRFLIDDSITGWADAIKTLMKSYFYGTSVPVFDYSDIRPKGALLVTSGGRAPGPEPLKTCIYNLSRIMDRKLPGEKLTSVEVYDLTCHIADAVLAGGIRRAALITLFSFDDQAMRSAKSGNWFELNPQRGRSNNSAVALRYRITKDEFYDYWNVTRAAGSGEPGLVFTNDADYGVNPCSEISLRPWSFCNLVTINANAIKTQQDLNEAAKAAAFIGTLQASYTDFHYLRDVWKRHAEKDALIGVSMTGIASKSFLKLNFSEAVEVVKKENERVAKLIGINKAARVTAIKPEGTASLILGSSSGIHAWHAKYYIRRLRVGKNESLYKYLVNNIPELVEDDFFKPELEAVISIPQKAPKNAIVRNESMMDLLERIKKINREWVHPGKRTGPNHNNVSATISVKENEWDKLIDWMWENREYYNGLSVLPYDGGTYVQAPFEEITKAQYESMLPLLQKIDLTKVLEADDKTDLQGEIACGGGACEVR